MMKSKLLLLSNSTNKGESFLSYPQPYIKFFLSKSIRKVLFIPYAGITLDHERYTGMVSDVFEGIGYEIEGIHRHDDPREAVRQAESIAVGGGNTFRLLQQLYKHELLGVIRDKVSEGMPYIGWSAGSNIAGPTIKTTNDMPVIEPPSFNALKLVPFQINPHYTEAVIPGHGGESRKQRLEEFMVMNPDMYVTGLPEGSMLHVEDGRLQYIGQRPLTLFKHGLDVADMNSEDDLNFLMSHISG